MSLPQEIINELQAITEPERLLKNLVDLAYGRGQNTIEIECEANDVEVYFWTDSDATGEADGFLLKPGPAERLISHIRQQARNGILTIDRGGTSSSIRVDVLDSEVMDRQFGPADSTQYYLYLP